MYEYKRWYSTENTDQIFVKVYEIFPFAKNMGKNFGKNISKSSSVHYSQDDKQSAIGALKNASKNSIKKKTGEETSDLIGIRSISCSNILALD